MSNKAQSRFEAINRCFADNRNVPILLEGNMPKGIKGFQKGHKQFNPEEQFQKGHKYYGRPKGFKFSKRARKNMSIARKKYISTHPNSTAFHKGHKLNIGKKRLDITGENHPNWKGGRRKDKRGYAYILKPSHPFSMYGGYILEHRLIMEQMLGRYLTSKEFVHHMNGIKDDNRRENLKLIVSHKNWHPKTCPNCGFEFLIR